jgi:hypothetical protein
MSEEYTLKINDQHRGVIQEALDMYARVLMGQWGIVSEKLMFQLEADQCHRLKDHLDAAKLEILGFQGGASHGIHSREIRDDARVAFDLHQVLRHAAYKRRPEEKQKGYGVDAYPASKSSTEVSLAQVVEG